MSLLALKNGIMHMYVRLIFYVVSVMSNVDDFCVTMGCLIIDFCTCLFEQLVNPAVIGDYY